MKWKDIDNCLNIRNFRTFSIRRSIKTVVNAERDQNNESLVEHLQEHSWHIIVSMAQWKRALAIFLIYYALLFIGAAIIMYIEAVGLGNQSNISSNCTKRVEEFFKRELNLQLDKSKISRVLQLSREIAKQEQWMANTEWKREISWKTMYKWRYFTHTTLTTVGMSSQNFSQTSRVWKSKRQTERK